MTKSILIIEVNWVGDVLFSTPFIKAVRKKFKDARITCVVDPRAREILEENPNIDDIILYDEKGKHRSLIGKIKFIILLRKKHFNIAFILHRSFTKALIAFLGGIKERVGYATKNRQFLLTKSIEVPYEDLHKVEYFLGIAEALGYDVTDKNYEFFTRNTDKKIIEDMLSNRGIESSDMLVVINPGGNWQPKQWSEDSFVKVADSLIDKYNAKVVISGAEKDIKKAERISSKMKKYPVILAGKTTLKELGALMERADFVISGDSGPMHIAIAKRANTIALFGPTSPELTGPYGKGNFRVIKKDIDCEIPCYDFNCTDYKCMDSIKPEDVLNVFDDMYKKWQK